MAFNMFELSPTDEVFSWRDGNTCQSLHFAVTQLNSFLDETGWPVVVVSLPSDMHEFLLCSRGVDVEHAESLSPEQLDMAVTMVAMPNGEHLMVDGSHRAYIHSYAGANAIKARLVPEEVWREFLIHGFPNMSVDTILGLSTAGLEHRAPKNTKDA